MQFSLKRSLLAKLILCYCLMLSLTVVMAWCSVANLNRTLKIGDGLYKNQLQSINYGRLAQNDLDEILIDIAEQPANYPDQSKEYFYEFVDDIDVVVERARSADAIALLTAIKQKLQPYIKALDAGEKVSFRPVFVDQLRNELEEVIEFEAGHGFELILAQQSLTKQQLTSSALVIAVGIGLILLLGFYLYCRLIKPITTLTMDIRNFKANNLPAKNINEIKQQDEVGQVVTQFKEMATSIERHELELQELIQQLNVTNDQLSNEITERKKAQAQMQELFQKVVKLSRQAGMYEVASELIHNLGNALNNLNTSVESLTASEALKTSHRAVEKLLEQLGASKDQQSSEEITNIFNYLEKISKILGREEVHSKEEIDTIKNNLDGMIELVQQQEKYAVPTKIIEPVNINELIKEVISINKDNFAAKNINLEYSLAEIPEVETDKTKLSQMLLNLLDFGCNNFSDSSDVNKQITITADLLSENRFTLKIAANAPGYAHQDLSHLFHQKSNEPGQQHIELHSSANIMEQLHGQIIAQSDGPDSGYYFELLLPIKLQ